MSVYLLMTALSPLCAYLAGKYDSPYPLYQKNGAQIALNRKFAFLLGSFLMIALVSVLREGIGADYYSYVHYFELNTTVGSEQEAGYILLNRLVGVFTDNPFYLFAVSGVITIGLFFYVILKESCNVPLSIYLFLTMGCFYQSLSAIRQMIAVAIVFLAFHMMKSGWWKTSLLMVILATLFHSSAVIMLLILPLSRIRLKQSGYVMAVFVAIGGGIVLFRPLMALIDRRYSGFYSSAEYFNVTLLLYHLILGFGTLLLCFLYYKPLMWRNLQNVILMNLALFSLGVIIAISVIPTLSRFVQYFIPFYILLLPELLESIQDRFTRRIFGVCLVVGYFAYSVFFIRTSSLMVVPYQSIWHG